MKCNTELIARSVQDIFVDGLNEVQLDLKDMPFLHREPSRSMVNSHLLRCDGHAMARRDG